MREGQKLPAASVMRDRRDRPVGAPRPWFELHTPEGSAPPAWCEAATWALIAAAALTLAWIAFRLHVVGDYSTESDFYGGYAAGARSIQRGHLDPARYPVVGPGYEACLALVGFAVRDLFAAARLISVASALGTLVLWRAILGRRAGAEAAFWTVAFLAANAVFVRYGYSSSTDMLAIVLQAAALHAVLVSDGKLAPLRSGVWAALATLTRYNSVFLVPAAIACYAGLAPAPAMSRRRAVVLHLGGFALVAAPWLVFSLASGHVPGASLFERYGSFYRISDSSRNVQDQAAALAESLATARSLGRVITHDPGAFVLELLGHVPDHLRRDATELLGLPVALLGLAGLLLARLDGTWRRLLPVWTGGALLFATLVPVFYSDRYSMALAPTYLTLAAAALASRCFALRVRPGGFHLKWLVGLIPLVLSVEYAVATQRTVLGNQPIEVLEDGRALARAAEPGARVMSRKPHIAYYSGCSPMPFPRLGTLAELGDYCRRKDVRFLYYSWYEARMRSEFAYLFDTTAVVPGLSVLHRSEHNPSVLFRVGPELGRTPEWFGDRTQRNLHLARAFIQYMSDSEAAPSHLLLASDEFDRGHPTAALAHVDAAMRGRPLGEEGWRIAGEALRALGRAGEAVRAYERALLIDPDDLRARLGLGWAQLGAGNPQMAARAWRPAIGPGTDAYTLRQMVKVYDGLGDRRAADAARAELARRPADGP